MAHVLAQVSIQRASGLAEDVAVNTIHFGTVSAAPTAAELDAITLRIQSFYTGGIAPTGRITDYFGSNIAGSGHTIKYYNMDLPPPRPPIRSDVLNLFTTSDTLFPAEIAVCLTLRANPVPGVPRGRLRGRLFIGPLTTAAYGVVGTSDARVRPLMMTAMLNAAVRLGARAIPATDPFLMVASPTQGAIYPVTKAEVDNAFDTMRSRGAKASSRVTMVIP